MLTAFPHLVVTYGEVLNFWMDAKQAPTAALERPYWARVGYVQKTFNQLVVYENIYVRRQAPLRAEIGNLRTRGVYPSIQELRNAPPSPRAPC